MASSGSDSLYQAMLRKAGINSADQAGYDAARLTQIIVEAQKYFVGSIVLEADEEEPPPGAPANVLVFRKVE